MTRHVFSHPIWVSFLLVLSVYAQSCENYGILQGTSCLCPVGFGGATCSQPACGGTIFQGSQRPLATSSGNLTAESCSCTSGWTGTGCNVCQTAGACQSGFARVGSVKTTSSSGGSQENNTIVCSTQTRVYASSQMSCRVDVRFHRVVRLFLADYNQNPTIQAVYPKAVSLNMMRSLRPSLSPIPNATSFGDPGTAFAQLFYDGVEQFYCQATSCTQKSDSTSGASTWQCSALRCTCRPRTDFCGGGSLDLTATINALSGTLELECGAVDHNTNTVTCNFKQSILQSLFGSNGLVLNGCTSGECVGQNVIDKEDNGGPSVTQASKSLNSGVIAGLAIVGGIALLSLLLFLFSLRTQRRARKAYADDERSTVSVEWSDLSYIIPGRAKSAFLAGLPRRRAHHNAINNDKVILDSVSGNVKPGQMMAVLGPSGQSSYTCQYIVNYLCRCW